MVIIIVVINISISLILFYSAWRMYKLRQRVARLTVFLTNCDRDSYALLHRTPEAIYLGKQNLNNLRKDNENLQVKLQQIKQILTLIVFGRQILWNRIGFRSKLKIKRK